MGRWLNLGLVALCLVSTTSASLRARYCIPKNHYYSVTVDSARLATLQTLTADTTIAPDSTYFAPSGGVKWLLIGQDPSTMQIGDKYWEMQTNGSNKKNSWVWYENNDYFDPGVWVDYDGTTGFDGTDDPLGNIDTVPAGEFLGDKSPIDSAIWVDSIAETGRFPFLEPNVDATLAASANIIVLYGQLTVPDSGEYTFVSSGRYEGLKFWIDINGDDVFSIAKDSIGLAYDTTVDALSGDTLIDTTVVYNGTEGNPYCPSVAATELPLSLMFSELGSRGIRVWTVTLPAGKYKVRAMYWGWGTEWTGTALGWKVPGADNAVVIPASAFGERKQFGVPYVTVPALLKNGEAAAAFTDTIACIDNYAQDTTKVAWVARVENVGGYDSATYTYTWIMQDAANARDTIVHTSTATTDTVYHDLVLAGNRGSRPTLSVTLVKGPTTLLLRAATGVTVKLYCDPATGIKPLVVAGRQAMRLVGTKLIANATSAAPVGVKFYSLSGRVVLSRSIRTEGVVMDLAKVGLPSGLYVARISLKGAVKKSLQVMIP